MRLIEGIAAPLIAALAWAAPAFAGSTGVIELNRPVPDIALPDSVTGRPLSLADFRGRRIVLHVFASW